MAGGIEKVDERDGTREEAKENTKESKEKKSKLFKISDFRNRQLFQR